MYSSDKNVGKEENKKDVLLEAFELQNLSKGGVRHEKGNPEKGAPGKESKWLKLRAFWGALKGDNPDGNSSKLFSFIQRKNTTLRNVVLAASTLGIERLLNAKAFNCPEKGHRQYGFAFLFAPVIILFCVNVLVIGEIWRLSSRMFVKRYRRRGDCVARVLPSLLKACVSPAVWLIAAFLEEDYYICAKLGPFTPRNETNNGTSQQEIVAREKRVRQCKSDAQIIAWVVFVALIVAGTAMIVWKKCYFKDKLLMGNHFAFERREALSAKTEFLKYARGDIPEDNDPNTEARDIEEGKPAAGDIRKENEPQTAAKHGSEEGKPIGRGTSEDTEDTDPNIAKYGNKEEKVKLYHKGVPELIGRKTVEKLFAGYKGEDWKEDDEWHYIKAYKAFKEMYPRISSGSPLDPWRRVQEDVEGSQKAGRSIFLPKRCQKTSSAADELKPMYADAKDPQLYRDGKKQKEKKDGSVVLPVAGSPV